MKTMRGVEFDMNRLASQHSDKVALGNANMNARGDIIDLRGNIIKKREDVAMEYHRTASSSVTRVALKDIGSEVFPTPAEAVAAHKAAAEAAQEAILNSHAEEVKVVGKKKLIED